MVYFFCLILTHFGMVLFSKMCVCVLMIDMQEEQTYLTHRGYITVVSIVCDPDPASRLWTAASLLSLLCICVIIVYSPNQCAQHTQYIHKAVYVQSHPDPMLGRNVYSKMCIHVVIECCPHKHT